MPKCNLTQDFFEDVIRHKPSKNVHYLDKDLVGFLLEYRTTGSGTWYYRYVGQDNRTHYFRIGTIKGEKRLDAIEAREQAYSIRKLILRGLAPCENRFKGHDSFIESQRSSSMVSHHPQNQMSQTHYAHQAHQAHYAHHAHQDHNYQNYTIENFIDEYYIPRIKTKKRSFDVDIRILKKHFLPFFAKRSLHGISTIDLSRWQENLHTKGFLASSANRILAVIRSVFNYAVRLGFLEQKENPCRHIERFPEKNPPINYLDKDKIHKALFLLKSIKHIGAKALQLLILTGARKSEILKARWEHFHEKERILTVPLSKSGKERHIFLSDEAIKIIKSLQKYSHSPWIFPNKFTDKPITSLYKTWDTVRKALHMPKVRIHDLRHSFASLLITTGSSLYEVQKILGHYNPKVTMRYAHLKQQDLVNAINRMELSREASTLP